MGHAWTYISSREGHCARICPFGSHYPSSRPRSDDAYLLSDLVYMAWVLRSVQKPDIDVASCCLLHYILHLYVSNLWTAEGCLHVP